MRFANNSLEFVKYQIINIELLFWISFRENNEDRQSAKGFAGYNPVYGRLLISCCAHASRAYMHTIIELALVIVYNDYTGVAAQPVIPRLGDAYLNILRER